MPRKNLPSSYKILPPETWAVIRDRYENGEPPRILTREYGIPDSTLYKRRKLEGWEVAKSTRELRAIDVSEELRSIETSVENVEGALQVPALIPDIIPADPFPDVPEKVENGPMDHRRQVVNQSHLESAALLRQRIDVLMVGENMGASPDKQPQAVKDLTMALERLQKIERLALKMDDPGRQAGPSVVILCPPKLSPAEWEKKARLDRVGLLP